MNTAFHSFFPLLCRYWRMWPCSFLVPHITLQRLSLLWISSMTIWLSKQMIHLFPQLSVQLLDLQKKPLTVIIQGPMIQRHIGLKWVHFIIPFTLIVNCTTSDQSFILNINLSTLRMKNGRRSGLPLLKSYCACSSTDPTIRLAVLVRVTWQTRKQNHLYILCNLEW